MPARSSREPTRNHIQALMIGALWISFNKTSKPFDKVVRVKLVSIALKFRLPLFGGCFCIQPAAKPVEAGRTKDCLGPGVGKPGQLPIIR